MPDYKDIYNELSDYQRKEVDLNQVKIDQREVDLVKRKERQDLMTKNKFLVGDNLWNFFYETDVKVNILKDVILADSYSKDNWLNFANKIQSGEATPEELVDAISMSHFNVCDEGDTDRTTEVLEDIVQRNLKGRLGQKLISSVIQELDKNKLLTADPETIQNLIEYKHDEENNAKNDSNKALIKSNTIKDNIHNNWKNELENVNYDQLRYVKYNDLIERLKDETDFQFDILHHVIFDCGFEDLSKKMVTGIKSFVIYTICLNNVFTDEKGKTKEEETTYFERSVTKFVVEDITEKEEKEIKELKNLINEKYTKLIDFRFNNMLNALKK